MAGVIVKKLFTLLNAFVQFFEINLIRNIDFNYNKESFYFTTFCHKSVDKEFINKNRVIKKSYNCEKYIYIIEFVYIFYQFNVIISCRIK